MEKRILLALVLSLAVLYGFRWWMGTPAVLEPPVAETTAATATPPPDQPNSARDPPPPTTAGTAGAVDAHSVHEETTETPLYAAKINNPGGVLTSFKLLKGYPDKHGAPTELINQTVGLKTGWPLTTVTGDAAL